MLKYCYNMQKIRLLYKTVDCTIFSETKINNFSNDKKIVIK